MINYYAELGLNPNASLEEIGATLKNERRKWTTRQNAPDLKVRQKAEQRLQLINEATLIFADKDKRQKYDRDLKKSGASAQSATQQQPETVFNPNATGDALIDLAEKFYEQGSTRQAIDTCRSALAAGLSSPKLYYVMGMCYLDNGKNNEAMATFQTALNAFPDDLNFLGYVSYLYIRTFGKFEQARSYINRALELSPDNSLGIALLAELEMRIGNVEKSDQIVQEFLAKYPNSDGFKQEMAAAYYLYANSMFSETSNGAVYVENQETYDAILYWSTKAKDMYPTAYTNNYNDCIELGKKKFNTNNLSGLFASFCICWPLCIVIFCCNFQPLWRINKEYFTNHYTGINAVANVCNKIGKAVWKVVRFILRLIFFWLPWW